MTLSAADLLAPGGPLARAIGDRYEPRPQQAAMAARVEETMQQAAGGRAIIEAGTGVGKSYAYLLPAILRAVRHGERVVVATNTITLQEQLFQRDLPAILAAMPEQLAGARAAIVKGRANYLSIRRLEMASRRQGKINADQAAARTMRDIEAWAYETRDGTRSSLPVLERETVWESVRSDSGNCMGRRCGTYEQCFFQQSRRAMERADILVCNHAVVFSDLALRMAGAPGFLPEHEHLVLDEAHGLEDAAAQHFGVAIREGAVWRLLGTLLHERTGRGALAAIRVVRGGEDNLKGAEHAVREAGDAARVCFDALAGPLLRAGGAVLTAKAPPVGTVENTISTAFATLAVALRRLREVVAGEEDKFEMDAFAERASAVADDAETLLERDVPGYARWLEAQRTANGGVRVTLAAAPVEVGDTLATALWNNEMSITLTSATLATAGGFGHTARRLGLRIGEETRDDDQGGGGIAGAGTEKRKKTRHKRDGPEKHRATTLLLGSPFDYANNVELVVDDTMPEPRDGGYNDTLAVRIAHHVRQTGGGAVVLFTSVRTMRTVAQAARPELGRIGAPLYVQGVDGERSAILDAFRTHGAAVLFGVASFWQGVDVPGDALRCVIVTRLPFEPPDRPLTAARAQALRAKGMDPFWEDALPRAVLRFKQGFGRLVRGEGDKGRVVVLDKRIVSTRYGRAFLEALPEGVAPRRVSAQRVP